MNRHEWEFEYTASALADAAEAWEAKKTEVMAKVKESGLTVHEGPAADFTNYTSNARQGAHVMVDTTLQADLSECVTKIREHRGAVKDYDGWAQVLRANPEQRIKLHQDDWLFFFGK